MAVLMSVAAPGTLCCYVNSSVHVQAIRLVHGLSNQFERIIFPHQQLMFEAPLDADLEVTVSKSGTLETQRISCEQLQVLTSI
ncbi:MAG: DUF1830 domain-containing protein [Synechococcus sp.]